MKIQTSEELYNSIVFEMKLGCIILIAKENIKSLNVKLRYHSHLKMNKGMTCAGKVIFLKFIDIQGIVYH